MKSETSLKNKSSKTVEQLPFFVYGTLRVNQGNWSRLLKGNTLSELSSVLPSAKMYSRGIAFVTDSSQEQDRVVGELMYVDPTKYADVLQDLDQLEGYDPTTDSGYYLRVKRQVEYLNPTTNQVERVWAWVYFGSEYALAHMTNKDRVLSGDWLAKRESAKPW